MTFVSRNRDKKSVVLHFVAVLWNVKTFGTANEGAVVEHKELSHLSCPFQPTMSHNEATRRGCRVKHDGALRQVDFIAS